MCSSDLMTHEIRTPLTAILGMAEIASESRSVSEIRAYLQRIRYNGDALLGLLNGLLDFSKIDQGQLGLEHRSFDLWDLAQSVVGGLASRAAEKRVDLQLRIDPALPAYVVGDELRLRQVLLNLTSNAVKFTEREIGRAHV